MQWNFAYRKHWPSRFIAQSECSDVWHSRFVYIILCLNIYIIHYLFSCNESKARQYVVVANGKRIGTVHVSDVGESIQQRFGKNADFRGFFGIVSLRLIVKLFEKMLSFGSCRPRKESFGIIWRFAFNRSPLRTVKRKVNYWCGKKSECSIFVCAQFK